ncbi:MAG: heavy-metal-associated domain-containing protein [Prevotella sp.]|nr:heavy-metal-associated domain-containing protein [Prevotella sp.]
MEIKTFEVTGMKCDHCKAHVENAIQSLAGVQSAKVSLADKNVTVEYDSASVKPEDMKAAVDGAGHYEMML